MSIYHSRHVAYSKKSVPRRKRAIQLYAEGDWKGKWYKCWNCGFINNIDRAQVADSFTGGDSVEVYEYEDTNPEIFGMIDPLCLVLTLDNPVSMNLMLLNADSVPYPIDRSFAVKITGGCSFCGSLNYR